MGCAPRACRTCVFFVRGQHKYGRKDFPNRYFSDCEAQKLPTHANCSACPMFKDGRPKDGNDSR